MKPNKIKLIIVCLFCIFIIFYIKIRGKINHTSTNIYFPETEYIAEDIPNEIGEFKIGDNAPHKPGDEIKPYQKIPPSKFYVYLWSPNPNMKYGCINEECGKNGEVVASLRGWLGGSGTTYEESVPLVNSSKVNSLIIVADQNSKVVGVYPEKDMPDLPEILSLHKDLADFKMLDGITQLGDLKLKSPLPFDPKKYVLGNLEKDIRKPEYYLIVVHETMSDRGYCPYIECGMFLETIFNQKGWFISIDHKNSEIIEKLGLNASQVARGEITLIILADKNKKIVSIHPNKDMRDIYTVLVQHPDLAPFMDFPWR